VLRVEQGGDRGAMQAGERGWERRRGGAVSAEGSRWRKTRDGVMAGAQPG
jgi:hypothetical protein